GMSGAAVGTSMARPMTGNVCTSYDAAMEAAAPTLDQIRAARERLGELIAETPLWRWRGDAIEEAAGRGTEVLLKLELFQHAGSFKPRGALCSMMALSPDALRRGVTAVSAGNHAMPVGYAARALGTTPTSRRARHRDDGSRDLRAGPRAGRGSRAHRRRRAVRPRRL